VFVGNLFVTDCTICWLSTKKTHSTFLKLAYHISTLKNKNKSKNSLFG
jgi:hypothetical protein